MLYLSPEQCECFNRASVCLDFLSLCAPQYLSYEFNKSEIITLLSECVSIISDISNDDNE